MTENFHLSAVLSLCETKECLTGPKESSEILLKTVILEVQSNVTITALLYCGRNDSYVFQFESRSTEVFPASVKAKA